MGAMHTFRGTINIFEQIQNVDPVIRFLTPPWHIKRNMACYYSTPEYKMRMADGRPYLLPQTNNTRSSLTPNQQKRTALLLLHYTVVLCAQENCLYEMKPYFIFRVLMVLLHQTISCGGMSVREREGGGRTLNPA